VNTAIALSGDGSTASAWPIQTISAKFATHAFRWTEQTGMEISRGGNDGRIVRLVRTTFDYDAT